MQLQNDGEIIGKQETLSKCSELGRAERGETSSDIIIIFYKFLVALVVTVIYIFLCSGN